MKKKVGLVFIIIGIALAAALAKINFMESSTIESRISDILAKKTYLENILPKDTESLTILVFKNEKTLWLYADRRFIKMYNMTGFSGELGPKLEEGDKQIPEGLYKVEYLNPNSIFYLSMRLNYPNEFDIFQGENDGREKLGGDIFIHGKNKSIGCIPVGDEVIEDLFYFVNKLKPENCRVLIAPYDMRKGRDVTLESSEISWYPQVCGFLNTFLRRFPIVESHPMIKKIEKKY